MTHRARRAWAMVLALLAVPAGAAQTVRYCDYPVYPPMSWSDGHQVRGLAPTVVRELFARMGYQVQTVVLGNWKRCLMDAAAGRVDVVLAYNSDQRDQRMH
ncbi:MAG: transporter substrate-binding domain-containing protein, partial [Pseudomonas putida]